MIVKPPLPNSERWTPELLAAWAALSHPEHACLCRERIKWRGWPPHRYGEGAAPQPARDGANYEFVHTQLWTIEKHYRGASKCRGAQAEG